MKKTMLLVTGCLMLMAYTSVSVVFAQSEKMKGKIQPEKNMSTHQMISIHYSGAVLPESVTVKPGSTVVWINDSKSPVEIQFEGKQVTLACKNPVHFVLSEEGYFISDRIPTGAVASICFIEPGEFSFVARKVPITYSDGLSERQRVQEFRGKVIVKRD